MKKALIVLVFILMLCGCQDKKEENNNNDVDVKYEEMKDKLIEYGKLIYENDQWLKGGIEPGTYYMNLRDMSERNNYDISMFINPLSNEKCDVDETRIEFIVKDTTTDEKTDYEFNPVLVCD